LRLVALSKYETISIKHQKQVYSQKIKKYQLILLSVLTGLIMALGSPARGFSVLYFIGFIPMLLMEDLVLKDRVEGKRFNILTVFFYSYIGFFVWNMLTIYWIWNSTPVGGIMAYILNTFFMTAAFSLFHWTRKVMNNRRFLYLSLFAYWISFEFIHLRWEFSFPWLHLGNGFASSYQWVQWYEYTGVLGGTFWVLLVNLILFLTIKEILRNKKVSRKNIINISISVFVVIIPIISSKIIYNKYEEKEDPYSVVIVQPNLDPWAEQYWLSPQDVANRMTGLADQKLDSLTDFVVCPESAIQERPLYESEISYSVSYSMLKEWLAGFDHLSLVVGASTYKIFNEDEPLTHTARKFRDAEKYYDAYNTAIFLDKQGDYQLYHKSRLTPGVEIMPYVRYLRFIEKLALDLGGTVGSLGLDTERTPFNVPELGIKVGTAICYESIYGEFCTGYVKNGASFLFVITNDGWWKNTPGHRQHLTFSSLRAIETRRSIARSANTGISAFVNQRGDISQATKYWTQDVIKQDINANHKITFYVKYGDYIGRIMNFTSILLLLITLSQWILKRSKGLNSKL